MKAAHRGLSLLELMAAVAILGIMTTLAVTGLQGMQRNQRVSNAQRSILLEVQEARQQARRSGQPVRLTFTTTVQDGQTVPALRWEQLDCTSATDWGQVCPIAACKTSACGSGGCTCSLRGTPVPIPAQLDASSLAGLCWLPGRDMIQVVAPAGTTTCDAANPTPTPGSLKLRKGDGTGTYQPDRVLSLNALTGALRMVDCDAQPTEPGCAP
jgi:prepilin-type N-terminal cleavage/methylation domain-containing protein